MQKSVLWFDIGYTLLYLDRENKYKEVLTIFGIEKSVDEIEIAFHFVDKLFMREYPGTLGKNRPAYMPWYLGVLNHRLGIKLDVCEVSALWLSKSANPYQHWKPFEFVFQVLEDLKRTGYRLGVISNWDPSALNLLEQHGLAEYFDPVIVSSEVGYEKPDQEIFQIALKKAGVTAEESIYIGDNYYDDVVGGRKVGMDVLLINRFGNLGVEEIAGVPLIEDISYIKDYLK